MINTTNSESHISEPFAELNTRVHSQPFLVFIFDSRWLYRFWLMLAKKDKICVFSENDRVLFAKIVNG